MTWSEPRLFAYIVGLKFRWSEDIVQLVAPLHINQLSFVQSAAPGCLKCK